MQRLGGPMWGVRGGFLPAWQQERPLTLEAVTALARSTGVWYVNE